MNIQNLSAALVGFSRTTKRVLILGSDAVTLCVALWLTFALHFDVLFPAHIGDALWLFVFLPLAALPICYYFGLYNSVIRYQGTLVVYSLLKGVTALTLVFVSLLWLASHPTISVQIVILFWLLAFLGLGSSRFFARAFLLAPRMHARASKPVIIYGAGAAGVQAALSLINGPEYQPVAFVDDNSSLRDTLIHGVRVHTAAELDNLVARYRVNTILLAMPSILRTRKKAILSDLEKLPVQVKTLPGISELVSGAARLDEFREIQIEDLLGREPVTPDKALLSSCVSGKVVMVTGAGGSIGGELARQILQIGPSKLVLFEISEWALYEIERDLRQKLKGASVAIELLPILGSVTDLHLLTQVMSELCVQTIYHAAAYKHVPLVEHNLLSGVRNNVIGTWRTVEAACAANVETFVLISTDKAVRPTNVMGASKRVAELVLQGINQRLTAQGVKQPVVSMVRFGNVLGSSGSVVPLFREQIKQGGPVTITHPEITRYFMTAPEAANLVIQAGAMASGGEVFVLDMGEPVRILHLARRMVRLAGHDICSPDNPGGEIEIQFSGLRPGEKLYEELLIGEGAAGTKHSKIMQASEKYYDWDKLLVSLEQLDQACVQLDCETVRALLIQLVSEYTPAEKIYDHLWASRENASKAKLIQPELAGSSELQ